jgi:two-component system, response regulator FlrC
MPTLLIVDDEPAIQSVLCAAFTRAGYEVKTAGGPRQAMELCGLQKFDAILSDVQMPGLDGHSLIRWVADKYPETRSVLMSGFDIHCGDCPLPGRCRLLQKPFLPSTAVTAIDQVLSQPLAGRLC